MRVWLKILTVILALMVVQACVSTGTQEITDPVQTDRLAEGRSTQSEVTAALGFPAKVTYDKQRRETWNYYYITEYPQAVAFVPIADGLAHGMKQTARVLTISFNKQGVIQKLQKSQSTGSNEVYPY